MKKIKKKLSLCLSVLIIGFLIGSSSLNNNSLKALIEEKNNRYTIDSFDSSTWNWTTTEVISDDNSDFSYVPSLVVDSAGSVHFAWESVDIGGTLADHKISYKRWDAYSLSWTTTKIISTESTTGSFNPCVATDFDNNLHVVWEDETNYDSSGADRDIFYKRWNAISSTWTTTEVVSTESTTSSLNPSLAVDSARNVFIAWDDYTNYDSAGNDRDIFYKHWNSSTSVWTLTEVISTESTDDSINPSLAVDLTGNVHIAWDDDTTYGGSGVFEDIFYKRWDSSSSAWTITEVVSTESIHPSLNPSLAVDLTGNVHITWTDITDYAGSGTDWDIFYKRWNASISAWTTTEVVSTESTSHSENPSLAADAEGNVYVAWDDLTNYEGAGTDQDIFYKRWDAVSSSWTTSEVVSTESTGHSYFPTPATDATGNVYIAWDDNTDYAGSGTDRDIFLKILMGPPAAAPELAFIVPNPTKLTIVNLDWNKVLGANTYYVYRSTSYIWSVDGLVPITTVSSSVYIDTVPSEGFYYYVIVAGNFAGNSSHSNCQYVEVKFTDLEAPELAPILPNPTDSDSISLVWDSIDGAVEYYVYRSVLYIWSVESLTPITKVLSNSYVDTLPSEDYFFYVIVASDGLRNGTHSNCEVVEYKLPHVREFTIISGLIIGAMVVSLVILKSRKNRLK